MSNIIELRPQVNGLALTKKSHPNKCMGECARMFCDEATRKLECRDCGRVVEPFDYLMSWALKGDRRVSDLKHLDTEIRLKRNELADLQRLIQNAKATKKRHV